MKTLCVSDLDRTTLNREPRLSAYTAETLGLLIEEASPSPMQRRSGCTPLMAAGLQTRLPGYAYNGVFLQDAKQESSFPHCFSPEVENLAGHLSRHPVSALAYALLDGEERVSWLPERENEGVRYYLSAGRDKRFRVSAEPALYQGGVFPSHLYRGAGCATPLYNAVRETRAFSVTFSRSFTQEEYWLEIMPAEATRRMASASFALLRFDGVLRRDQRS